MQRKKIPEDLESASFEFFYWFSRFEFALKENKFLKNKKPGSKAEPSWRAFKEEYMASYVSSVEAQRLITLHPKRQIVIENQKLDWIPVGVDHCNNDLCEVIAMLKTIRNNLFHGGKHGDADVDSKDRNLELLKISKVVLDQLVALSELEADYQRCY